MASMMGGDFVEAYVLKNAYKDKVRRMEEEAEAWSGAAGAAPAGEQKKEAVGSGRGGGRGGLFGLVKKKVHPGAAGSAMEAGGGCGASS